MAVAVESQGLEVNVIVELRLGDGRIFYDVVVEIVRLNRRFLVRLELIRSYVYASNFFYLHFR